MQKLLLGFSFSLICFFNLPAFGQLGNITFDLQKDKPKKYQNRTLRSEKTGEKKLTIPGKIMQNTVTHYNYYFNASNKLNGVLERAKNVNKENYTKLLPFYGYSLNTTAAQKTELDSVIYKATAGILLHDLRNDWVDNLYLLIGKAYYLQKEFDSASMTFQFINYNLYPRNKKDDEQLVVGTNTRAGGNMVSIANKENRNIVQKTFSLPPSRNDALIWQIRTLIETNTFPEAAGLINTLQNDQNFPERLKADLQEVNAYWFYKQGIYDSAAFHLEKALSAAENKQDMSRWEFLIAQLYEVTKQYDKASRFYEKAMKHTTDPLLDIYANLNNAKMYKGNEVSEIDNSIANLTRMSKKFKYENYRDIIFYSAGVLELEKKDTTAAEFFFLKSIHNSIGSDYKTRDFLQLADIAFTKKDFKHAFAYYDSVDIKNDALIGREKEIQERKAALAKIVERINLIETEDSLQRIAAMPAADREAYIRSLVKKIRKEKGLKEDNSTNNSSAFFNNSNDQSIDLFAANNTKGDWYFYNADVKSRGYSEFRSRWGQRSNTDNWRRKAALNSPANTNVTPNIIQDATQVNSSTASSNTDVSYESLLGNLPLTEDKLDVSNTKIAFSLFELGKLYQNNLEDYKIAAQTYETALQRFPNNLYSGELYFNLIYCYEKLGDLSKASYYKNLLLTKFNNSKYSQLVLHPQVTQQDPRNAAITKRYEDIYNLFIEGQFEKAVQEKRKADSLYGNTYWTPQLLYIESVYYIKQKQDSIAINVLNQIVNGFPTSPLKEKAVTMIDVLKRRKEIEAYLTTLNIKRYDEDAAIVVNEEKPVVQKPVAKDTVALIPKKETKQLANPDQPTKQNVKPPATVGSFSFIPEQPQNVVMILDKVDPVYVSEARNAFNRYNREKFAAQNIEVTRDALDKDKNILIFKVFTDANAAISYADKIKEDAVSEISWLPANKYSFIIISDANLQILKSNNDLQSYLKLLNTKYPGKF